MAADGQDFANLILSNVRKALSGEETRAGADLARFLKKHTPGRSLWYLRLGAERLVFDEIDRLVDPDAPKRFHRAEKRVREEFG